MLYTDVCPPSYTEALTVQCNCFEDRILGGNQG